MRRIAGRPQKVEDVKLITEFRTDGGRKLKFEGLRGTLALEHSLDNWLDLTDTN
jgi:hypothetical protein